MPTHDEKGGNYGVIDCENENPLRKGRVDLNVLEGGLACVSRLDIMLFTEESSLIHDERLGGQL